MENIQSWGEAVLASFTAAMAIFFAAIPKIIGFLAIIIVGWLVASLIARGISALLRAVRFNELSQRSGFSGFVHSMGVETDASGFIALVSKWFVRLIALVVAFDALGLPAVSEVLRQLLLWLPNLVVALVVLVIGGLVATAFANLVRGATAKADFENPDLVATVTRVSVWAFAIVVALTQLGIATTLINTIVMALVGAVALAFGLAFGLGGRETASQIVRRWYSNDTANKLGRAAEAGRREVEARTQPLPQQRRTGTR